MGYSMYRMFCIRDILYTECSIYRMFRIRVILCTGCSATRRLNFRSVLYRLFEKMYLLKCSSCWHCYQVAQCRTVAPIINFLFNVPLLSTFQTFTTTPKFQIHVRNVQQHTVAYACCQSSFHWMLPMHSPVSCLISKATWFMFSIDLRFPSLLRTIIRPRLHATSQKEIWTKPPLYFFHSIFLLSFH